MPLALMRLAKSPAGAHSCAVLAPRAELWRSYISLTAGSVEDNAAVVSVKNEHIASFGNEASAVAIAESCAYFPQTIAGAWTSALLAKLQEASFNLNPGSRCILEF